MTHEDQRQYGAMPGEQRAYEDFMLKLYTRRMLRALDRCLASRNDRLSPEQVLLWAHAWSDCWKKYRAQVEQLIG